MVKLSILIPAYNEGERVGKTLKEYVEFFKNKKESFEIYVILNGCRDNTLEVVDNFSKKYSEISYRNIKEAIGKGDAIIEGIYDVDGDYIAYADADGATPPEQIYLLMSKISNYDGIIGSRWVNGAVIVKKQTFIRLLVSRAFNLLTKIILGLPYKDTQCGSKIFKKEAIKKVAKGLKGTKWAFDACLLFKMKKNGFSIKEVPIVWEEPGSSRLKIFKAAPAMFFTIVKVRLGLLK
jgi:glycosyltransferase involved in cell wall biosynthesis